MNGDTGKGTVTIRKKTLALIFVIVFLVGMAAAMGGTLLVTNGIIGGTVKLSKNEYAYYQQLDERYAKLNQLYDEVMDNFYKKPDC